MHSKKYGIVGLLVGFIIGWFLSYIGLPLVTVDDSFWIGCLLGGTVLLVTMLIFNRLVYLNRLQPSSATKQPNNTSFFIKPLWLTLIIATVVFLGVIFLSNSWYINLVDERLKDEKRYEMHATKSLKMHQNNQLLMLHFWMRELQQEMAEQDSLSAASIHQIAAWTHAILPYNYSWSDPSLKTSPERGLLLQKLLALDLDSNSMATILAKATFAFADLESCTFKQQSLTGIDLRAANLETAVFEQVDLSKANLEKANIRFARFSEVHFNQSNLNGVQGEGLQFNQVTAQDGQFEWADLPSASFYQSYLNGGSFLGANLQQSLLQHSSLIGINFKRSNLKEIQLKNIQIDSLIVGKDWPQLWEKWAVLSDVNMLENRIVQNDSSRNVYRWIHLIN